ncbi:hypothetical protein E7Y32_08350 [Arthrobacter sp. UKPF54-2]|uniref:hypothetical protein n=1 Tax=Arthrobacter sp. UKPF54-2 TaxID=2600159 RepID=UPI0011B1700C|nr:hypothetical protein [Arthrobacter sp. UKPF54-2]QDY90215.1 hypothetical protein E7Y32_08350 [Arthrobacter sp. UKPF54-2]
MSHSPSGRAPTAGSRALAWFPVTRTGKIALTLAYVTVLSPAWVLLVLGQAVFQAGASDDIVVILLVVTVVMLWAALLWAKDRSLLVAAFAVLLSAALMYFLWWAMASPGTVAG